MEKTIPRRLVSCLLIIIPVIVALSGCIEEEPNSIKDIKNQIVIEGKGDYTSIQNAIDNASAGDTIFVYSGTYYETLVINKSVNLIGDEKLKPVISFRDENESIPILVSVNADNCTIENFIIDGSEFYMDVDFFGVASVLKISSSNNRIENNVIINSLIGVYLNRNSENNKIFYNQISNNENGIYGVKSSGNEIKYNNISTNNTYGIYLLTNSNENNISGNIVSYNINGIRLKSVKYNTIFRNKISYNTQRGIYICCGATDNIIFYNSIIQNSEQAYDAYNNDWNNSNTGNYWSDYEGEDNDGNEIGDTPYDRIIGGENIDNFPLIRPVRL